MHATARVCLSISKHNVYNNLFTTQPRLTVYTRYFTSSSPDNNNKGNNNDPFANVVYLRDEEKGRNIYLLATAHVSSKSVEDVRALIHAVKADTVMVELCATRYANMKQNMDTRDVKKFEEEKPFDFESVIQDLMKTLSGGAKLDYNIILKGMKQMQGPFKMLGVLPGAEIYTAITEAEKIGAKLVKGDMNIQDTINGLIHAVATEGLKPKYHTDPDLMQLFSRIKGAKDKAELEKLVNRFLEDKELRQHLLADMKKNHPKIHEALLDRRDKYLTRSLIDCGGQTVVGIVGAAHQAGIEQYWNNRKTLSTHRELEAKTPELNFETSLKFAKHVMAMLTAQGMLPNIFSKLLESLPNFPGFSGLPKPPGGFPGIPKSTDGGSTSHPGISPSSIFPPGFRFPGGFPGGLPKFPK